MYRHLKHFEKIPMTHELLELNKLILNSLKNNNNEKILPLQILILVITKEYQLFK